jgi:long-chain fatty acid transport protein
MHRIAFTFVAATAAAPLLASNGLNLIGVGAESALMGGADVAVARDTTALNSNPAGLAQLRGRTLDVFGGVAIGTDVGHRDGNGNDRDVSNRYIALAGFGYGGPIPGTSLAWAVGAFAQGGAGVIYKDLATAFGTRDDLRSIFRIGKFAGGLAWQATPALSVGASLSATYGDVNQRVFPATSFLNVANPAASFFGTELKEASVVAPTLKLGAMYVVSPALTLGAAYTHPTPLPLKDGTLTANMTAIGLGRVTYANAEATGLGLPREVTLGAAVRPSERLLLSFELGWIHWAGRIGTTTTTATRPDNGAAPATLSSTGTQAWKNQWVFAFGGAWEIDEHLSLRAGFNYGRSPVPQSRTNPLLAAIAERHYTAGLAQKLGRDWRAFYGIEYTTSPRYTYDNPELPFLPASSERNEFPVVHLMLSRRW